MENNSTTPQATRRPEPVQEMFRPAGDAEDTPIRVAYCYTSRRRNGRLSPPARPRRRNKPR